MKKTMLALTAAALTALMLFSCGEDADADTFLDLYQLTTMVVPIDNANESGTIAVPAKFNAASGTLTPLCQDPLCDHGRNSGCVFGTIQSSSLIYDGGWLYYETSSSPGSSDTAFMRYSLTEGTVEKVCNMSDFWELKPETIESTSSGRQISCGYLWFRNRNSSETVFQARMHLDSGKIEVIDKDAVVPSFRYGKKFIFPLGDPDLYVFDGYGIADNIDGEGMETLFDGKIVTIAFDDLLDEDILLYCTAVRTDRGGIDWEHMTMWAYDLKTGEDRVILENFTDVYIAAAGDYIYYTLYKDELYLGYDANSKKDRYSRSGGILWRTHIETGETEKVYELPAYQLDGVKIERVGQYIVNEYTNVDYNDYEIIEDPIHGDFYDYKETTGRIVYDTVSGEYKIYDNGEKINPGATYVVE